jgi:phytoene dehydrogenase-like protein
MIFRAVALCQVVCLLSSATAFNVGPNRARNNFGSPVARVGETKLHLLNFFGRKSKAVSEPEPEETGLTITQVEDFVTGAKPIPLGSSAAIIEADVVVVGGGVSGLTAAITAAEAAKKMNSDSKVILVEASSDLGGRVLSEKTHDGFVLDRGFAVFIEEYPEAKKLLDYDALKLKPFLPGALVKLKSRNKLARIADPLRQPGDTINALLAPIGSLRDKVGTLPLILNVRIKSVEELFEENETDTETALIQRWGFSDDIISKFFKPFLEGIYLVDLSKQSSRMFSFIFKMFSEGSATLPEGGIGAVSTQLVEKAKKAGVEIRTELPVTRIAVFEDDGFIVECAGKKQRFKAPSVVLATDGQIAQRMLSAVEGFESLSDLPEQPQLSVGCLYYGFEGNAPVEEPILVLNGIGEEAGSEKYPVNTVCFPSVVNKGYAPDGYNLCSVTVPGKAMEAYKGRPDELDQVVRRQLGTWFREQRSDIIDKWELKKIFFVSHHTQQGFVFKCSFFRLTRLTILLSDS